METAFGILLLIPFFRYVSPQKKCLKECLGWRMERITIVTGCLLKIWSVIKKERMPLVRIQFDDKSDCKQVCALPTPAQLVKINSFLEMLETNIGGSASDVDCSESDESVVSNVTDD